MIRISILGSTGSIGRSTLEVVSRSEGKMEVVGLSAGRNIKLLKQQVEEFRPKVVSLEREEDAQEFKQSFQRTPLEVRYGQEGVQEVARLDENDIVISAITGINGLRSTMAAVQSGKRVALANKESMVVAGPLILEAARKSGAQIIPVDSEHSGVFQCLARESQSHVKKVILTASGGPFFRLPTEEMGNKTLEEVLNHPRWKMGMKVTIDSATLMNKGLELIEARWLFGLEPEQLDILIHPQSIVHSLVEMKDGSVLAQ
ncbi:MAG: 1-deoxy-D-xylulose-5-phosphate reductoisomerase, partial [Candidatus Aminicenantes bacterium]|nr:1-deoxy-D-xylulose-5-phosphate reductoisomerase [Candidatus Aminicenantes bacterium]